MALRISRREVPNAIVNELRKCIPSNYLRLVKPYEGEMDKLFSRYAKIQRVKSDMFPAEVQLTTPFALVVSADRTVIDSSKNRSLRFRHDISIFIGGSTSFDFASDKTPDLFDLMDMCVDALSDKYLGISGTDHLRLDNHGEYIVKTDLFTVYEQRYHLTEIVT